MFPLDLKSQAVKSSLMEVPKKWGREYWVANCNEYCGKLLILNKGAKSSYHYHKIKKETFYCLKGQVALTIDGKDYMLNPFARPKTIFPNTKHGFWGITDAIILEVSTHHEDEDVVRLTESKRGENMELLRATIRAILVKGGVGNYIDCFNEGALTEDQIGREAELDSLTEIIAREVECLPAKES